MKARSAHAAGLLAVVLAFVTVGTCAAARMPPESSAAPLFTEKQAAAGRVAFAERCASCHMADLSGSSDAPPLAGELFVSSWRARTTKELFDYMSAAMPPGGPSLSSDVYASVAAHILKVNGAVAGTVELTPTTAVAIGDVVPRLAPSR
jgi:mono/diheme cytochrome c family protein